MDEDVMTIDATLAAASAYRVYEGASGRVGDWDGLSIDAQLPWVRLAQRAERVLEKIEGCTWEEAATALYEDSREAFGMIADLSPILPWVTVARHLMTLMNADDIKGPADSEQFWIEWAKKKGNL